MVYTEVETVLKMLHCHDVVAVLNRLHGLHFPATDLPQRVRDQFKVNQVRIIVDAK